MVEDDLLSNQNNYHDDNEMIKLFLVPDDALTQGMPAVPAAMFAPPSIKLMNESLMMQRA